MSIKEGLEKLREPFPENCISLLPKPYKKDSKKGHCNVCGGYHGLPAVHLKYVGHAALTDRLLDVDPEWNWEPLSYDETGLPLRDKDGGMWIKLTVCGVTRIGYGDAQKKTGPDATKELIGDALRNAAMRFGAALDLWHKGDLHGVDNEDGGGDDEQTGSQEYRHETMASDAAQKWIEWIDKFATATLNQFESAIAQYSKHLDSFTGRDQELIARTKKEMTNLLKEKENK